MDILKNRFTNIPYKIAGLGELAYNLWWSWHPEAKMLFKMLDRQLWKESLHNPVKMLKELPPEILESAANNPDYIRHYDSVLAKFKHWIKDRVSPSIVMAEGVMHDPSILTLGFARRMVKDFEFSSPKFIRRGDLSILDRINIAHTALMAQKNNDWGAITALSNFYMISRSFVYMLAHNLMDTSSIIFGPTNSNQIKIDKKLSFNHMLSLRMEGRCSIEATSTIMKRFGINLPSTGSISQYLKQLGLFVPNTLATENDEFQMVVFLSDKIFSKNIPILKA